MCISSIAMHHSEFNMSLHPCLQNFNMKNVFQGNEAAAGEESTLPADSEKFRHLQEQLKHARVRIRELEHDCRLNSSVADEVVVLQQQLELTAQQSSEWQRKHAYAASPRALSETIN